MWNLFRFVGLRHLASKPVRTVLTCISVALGVALFVAIQLINRSTLESFKENFTAISGKAVLAVTAGETGFPDSVIATIEKVPGVRSSAPMIETRAYLAAGDNSTQTIQIFGVDMLRERSVRSYKTTDEQPIEDPLVFLNQPDSIIVSKPFAAEHKLQMDSTLDLATAIGVKRFTVRGIMNAEGPAKAYGGNVAIMDIDGAAFTFGKPGKVDRVDVMSSEGVNVDELALRLKAALGPAFSVEPPEGQSQGMTRMVASYQKLMSLISSLAVMVGLFMVTNTISMSVAERRKEVGTLRALGATKKGILTLFLTEATLMGTVGAFVGCLAGNWLAHRLVASVATAMSQQFLTTINTPAIRFSLEDLVRAALMGAVAGLLAALWPALKTNSIQPIEAIRSRKDEEQKSAGRMVFWTFWIGLASIVYLTGYNVAGIKPHNSIEEGVNQALGFLGVALVAPQLSAWIVGAVRWFVKGHLSAVSRLGLDNLLRNPKRTASNVLTLMVGLVLVVLISTMNASFRNSISEWVEKALQADLFVSSSGRAYAFQSQPIHEDIEKELLEIPEIKNGLMYRPTAIRFIHFQHEGHTFGLKAYDAPDPATGYSTFDMKDRPAAEAGHDLFESSDFTIMVSTNLVLKTKQKTGDHMTILTPSGPAEARIVGVMTDFASNEGVVYMDRRNYKKRWNDPLVNFFSLRMKDGTDLEAVRRAIDAKVGKSKNLIVGMNQEFKTEIVRMVDQSFGYLQTIELAALLIALLGLFNTMSISIMERIREFGLLRAVGMARGQVFRMVLLESLAQGAVSIVLGLLAGSWLAYLWIRFGLEDTLGWTIHFYFPVSTVLRAAVLGLLVAWLAGLLPSRRAANLQIREALTYE